MPRAQVFAGLATIAAIESVAIPDEEAFAWALDRFAAGADFADLIHLLIAPPSAEAFATFDRKLIRQAGEATPIAIRTLTA